MINKPDHAQNANQAAELLNETRAPVEAGLQQLAAACHSPSTMEDQLLNLQQRVTGEGWMEKVRVRNGERTVSANELTSLSALIVYVAHVAGASEFRIERELADRFNVPNVKCLPSARFDDAIRHLVDQVPLTVAA
jgi:hypothetical protein